MQKFGCLNQCIYSIIMELNGRFESSQWTETSEHRSTITTETNHIVHGTITAAKTNGFHQEIRDFKTLYVSFWLYMHVSGRVLKGLRTLLVVLYQI